MVEDPRDQVDLCIEALNGVCDLLAAVAGSKGDLHVVDPENLYALLRVLRDQMCCASEGLRTA